MKPLTAFGRYSVLFALLHFTQSIHAKPITIEWKMVINNNGNTEEIRPFNTMLFTSQNGQQVYTYRLLGRESQQRSGIRASGLPLSGEGDNLIKLLVEALEHGSHERASNRVVSLEAFPIHWLNGIGGINTVALDRVHFLNDRIAYVNLHPVNDATDLPDNEGGASGVNAEVNLAFNENHSAPVVGVILHQSNRSEMHNRGGPRVRLFVIRQALDHDTVSAILNNRATDYFVAGFGNETRRALANSNNQPEQNQAVIDLSPEAPPQEAETNYTSISMYAALLCCCRCFISSGSYDLNQQ